MIVINFKNYVNGRKAVNLAREIEKYLPLAIVVVPDFDIREIASKTKLKVFAQHVDYFKTFRATGFNVPEVLKASGAEGSLLNHSEHRLRDETIERTVKRAKDAGLKIILCVESVKHARKLKELKPWAIAFEAPELVASGKSITSYRGKDVEKFVRLLKNTRIIPFCGAGISSKWDVLAAKELGCKGVLISSAIASAKNPEKILKELHKI